MHPVVASMLLPCRLKEMVRGRRVEFEYSECQLDIKGRIILLNSLSLTFELSSYQSVPRYTHQPIWSLFTKTSTIPLQPPNLLSRALRTTLCRLSWPTCKPCPTRPQRSDGSLPVLSVLSGPPRRHLMSANWISDWYVLD
jgi:hypothetical protein